MEAIQEVLERIRRTRNAGTSTVSQSEARTASSGGADCALCGDKGWYLKIKDGREFGGICKCVEIRASLQRIEKSGLGGLLEDCTFDTFIVSEDWQNTAKTAAMRFAESQPQKKSSWLFLGGQVGAGKTHLCTAVVGHMMNKGNTAKYMLWRDASVRLKSLVNDDEAYAEEIEPFKTADILYIDDFFKTARDKSPTAGDINLAFEILNFRYIRQESVTIISSELIIDEIKKLDEAVASRIYQRTTKEYRVEVNHIKERNYRFYGQNLF